MPLFHHLLRGPVLRVGLPAGLAACCIALAVWRGGADWSVPGLQGGPDRAADGQASEDICRDILRRAAEKQRLAGEVIEGRLSLWEAAARYRDLDERPPPFNWHALRDNYPGASDDECHCRAVIVFVGQELKQRPGADPALPGQLEAELQSRLGRGDLQLPGPVPSAP